jgi:hypothetical protein
VCTFKTEFYRYQSGPKGMKDKFVSKRGFSIKNIVPDPAIVNILNNQTVNGSQVLTGLNQTNSEPRGDSAKFETTILVI